MQLTLQQYPSRLREMLNRNFDLDIKSNYSLEKSNTFGLNVVSESFYIVKNLKDLKNILWENRAKKITDIYKVPKKAGSYAAKKIGSLNTNSIITGGDYKKDLNMLVLTSTIDFKEYYFLKIENFDLNKKNYSIDMFQIPIKKTQIEAVKIIDSFNFWLSSENEKNGYPYLYKFSLND